MRSILLLQEFNITVLDRLRKENRVAYFLSLVQNEGEVVPVEDSFPNDNLFAVSSKSLWFENIANYLSIGRLPTNLSHREKK